MASTCQDDSSRKWSSKHPKEENFRYRIRFASVIPYLILQEGVTSTLCLFLQNGASKAQLLLSCSVSIALDWKFRSLRLSQLKYCEIIWDWASFGCEPHRMSWSSHNNFVIGIYKMFIARSVAHDMNEHINVDHIVSPLNIIFYFI